MSDSFDDFNKILQKDIFPILVKYLKHPNKISDNLNYFLNDPPTVFTNMFEKFSRNINNDNIPSVYTDIKNVTDIEPDVDDEYDDLLERLILIEEKMIQLEKILKNKN